MFWFRAVRLVLHVYERLSANGILTSSSSGLGRSLGLISYCITCGLAWWLRATWAEYSLASHWHQPNIWFIMNVTARITLCKVYTYMKSFFTKPVTVLHRCSLLLIYLALGHSHIVIVELHLLQTCNSGLTCPNKIISMLLNVWLYWRILYAHDPRVRHGPVQSKIFVRFPT